MKFYRRDGIFSVYPMPFKEYQRQCDRDPSLPTYDFAEPNDPGYLVEDFQAACNAHHKDYAGMASWYPAELFKVTFGSQAYTTMDDRITAFKHITGDQVLVGVRVNVATPDEELYASVYALGGERFTPLHVKREFESLRIQVIRYHPEAHPVPVAITMQIPLTEDVLKQGLWILRDLKDDTLVIKSSTALFRHYDKISRGVESRKILNAPNNEGGE